MTSKLEEHHSLEELEEQYRSTQGLESQRWHAIWLYARGRTQQDIADILGVRQSTVSSWVIRYREEGREFGKDSRIHNGAALKLDEEQQEQLREALEGPASDGGLWNGPKVQAYCQEHFDITLSANTARDYMRRLGFELQRGRKRHRKGDKQAQEDFKKRDASTS